MTDRGAKALAERIHVGASYPEMDGALVGARRLLGTTGLFIPDVTKHEPIAVYDPEAYDTYLHRNRWVECECGWSGAKSDESYFDHTGAS